MCAQLYQSSSSESDLRPNPIGQLRQSEVTFHLGKCSGANTKGNTTAGLLRAADSTSWKLHAPRNLAPDMNLPGMEGGSGLGRFRVGGREGQEWKVGWISAAKAHKRVLHPFLLRRPT